MMFFRRKFKREYGSFSDPAEYADAVFFVCDDTDEGLFAVATALGFGYPNSLMGCHDPILDLQAEYGLKVEEAGGISFASPILLFAPGANSGYGCAAGEGARQALSFTRNVDRCWFDVFRLKPDLKDCTFIVQSTSGTAVKAEKSDGTWGVYLFSVTEDPYSDQYGSAFAKARAIVRR